MGVALVRVADAGALRWNSDDGTRPPETALHSAPAGHRDGYGIGRLVTVERLELLSGRWTASGPSASYWRPGGQLGSDRFEPEINIPELSPGQRAIALLTDADAGAETSLPVQAGWLFPVDAAGRVQTLDPTEQITLDSIGKYLP